MEQNNNTLPAEVVDEINLSAKAFAAGMWPGIGKHDANQRIYVESVWEAGATEWASKLHELQKELKLATHSSDAYKKAFVEKVEWQDNAKVLLAEVFQKHESGLLPDRFVYEKIKKFLYGE